jgi:RNA polymerase sigma factor (sigma-70 family)
MFNKKDYMDIKLLVKKAVNGDQTALEGVIAAIQDNIYYLALRMLVNPNDAQDATQDILIKVITNLSSFRHESKFNTWVYSIASRYLISEKKVINRELGLTFDLYKTDLEQNLHSSDSLSGSPDYEVMLNELRISCTMAMLLCLNLPHRMAYILGYILEIEHSEASSILSISKENYRKQLSRAKEKVFNFTGRSCGLVTHEAKCRCDKKLTTAIERQRINPEALNLGRNSNYTYIEIKDILNETQQGLKSLKLQQSISAYKCPEELGDIIGSLVTDGIKRMAT